MVFDLKSRIIGRTPDKTYQIEGPLYKHDTYKVVVTNKFENDGDFSVQLL
jgi:hypothetical protein